MEYCFSCMCKTENGQACPRCGYVNGFEETPSHHLTQGSILSGKYLIGKSIGEGGFGITYVGMDLNLERKVAVKEYFPSGIVTRNGTDTITVFTGDSQTYFMEGREKFINEARALAKLDNLPGIVAVTDFFMENGTSYIVMEFVEGRSFKSILKDRGRMDSEEVFAMLRSLISSLQQVHRLGIIHRDISPDNIMITGNSQVKLIDFGAARSVAENKSLSIQLKPGFAPEEQYRTRGNQGPWTDVYAVCATMYRAITGILPPESLERVRADTLKSPSELGIAMDRGKEQTLMRGLAVFSEDRLKSMEELYNGLYAGIAPAPAAPRNIPLNTAHNIPPAAGARKAASQNRAYGSDASYGKSAGRSVNPIYFAVIIPVTVILIALCVLFFILGRNGGKDEFANTDNAQSSTVSLQTAAPTVAPTAEPTPEPVTIYRVSSYSPNLTYKRMDEIHNSVPSEDSMLLTMENFIGVYVRACDDYINAGSGDVFLYLAPGTTAYSQQTGYKEKHPSLTQQCISYSVQDVRQYGGYYYVWDTEELSETENGSSKVSVNHWVYKLSASDNTYKVIDYTYDPAYK